MSRAGIRGIHEVKGVEGEWWAFGLPSLTSRMERTRINLRMDCGFRRFECVGRAVGPRSTEFGNHL
jgi:hypothetical protein